MGIGENCGALGGGPLGGEVDGGTGPVLALAGSPAGPSDSVVSTFISLAGISGSLTGISGSRLLFLPRLAKISDITRQCPYKKLQAPNTTRTINVINICVHGS